jgi:hypothetical protein
MDGRLRGGQLDNHQFEKIRDAASPGHDRPPAKETSQVYRDALARVWILDEVPA